MEVIKKLNDVLSELKKIGVYALSSDHLGVYAQMSVENLKKLDDLEMSVKLRNGYKDVPYEVFTIVDGVKILTIATREELKEHFPSLAEEMDGFHKIQKSV